MKNCTFCEIVTGELQADKVAESDKVLAFKDINPKAPVHILLIPKRHANAPEDLTPDELSEMFRLESQLAKKFKVDETGYRLVFNIGKDANQEVDHVHLHLLGGAPAKSIY